MAAERFRRQLMQNDDFYPAGLPQPINPRFGNMGYASGHSFDDRQDLSKKNMHAAMFAGISGTVYEGAFSVVVSGGYADDVDEGDTM
ncbi:hypothetical protein DXG03_006502 [Asterophora parasitica]|uniref:YDG domain-containing protein n=1 Tax=Asterophora parasitica TaxID=117018 RepID=A0A9P7KC77_9AGAR|nr:hypothetical protein DXG03_006502 [Asterophora parasitica]